jgi:hypothetical protein
MIQIILHRPYCIAINTINVIIISTNQLNKDLNEYQKNIGQVEPTPDPGPQNSEHPGDDEKEESV